jgi:hypothetical protein
MLVPDGAGGDRLLFRIVTEEVGTDEDGEPVVGAVAVHEQATPAGEPGRPPKQKLTERQERVLQELQKQARERRSWDFTFAEFTEVCRAAGVLADVENDSTRRNLVRDLRHQLANRKAIMVDGKAEKVRLAR